MNRDKKIAVAGIIVIMFLSVVSVSGLYTLSKSLSELEKEKQDLQTELKAQTNELDNVNAQISNTQNEIIQTNLSLEEISSELEKLMFGKRYNLSDPWYWQVESFLFVDQTNNKWYDDETFNCENYAQEVNNNAEEKGFRCAFVVVNLSGPVDHTIVAFKTINKGIVYYEPQNDYKVNLEVGKDYWADCITPPPGYYYPRDPTWIIEDFVLYW